MVTPKGDQGSGSAVHTVVLNLPLVRSWVTEASALFHVFSRRAATLQKLSQRAELLREDMGRGHC